MVVEELMSLPSGSAAIRAEVLCRLWGFPNTYCLAKHLTEQMVSCTGVSLGETWCEVAVADCTC